MKTTAEQLLINDMRRFYADPLGFVMYSFPWDDDPALQVVELQEPWASRYKRKYGPDKWACEMLEQIGHEVKRRKFNGRDPVEPLRMAVASGHGIGKSTITAWIVCWIMSTRPLSRGTVTANTSQQLESKTWAEVAKWMKRCITSHWFTISSGRGSMKMQSKEAPEAWYCHAQTCREENSESFAGQHAVTATSFYVMDEGSAIPDKIYEVANGGMTDGEPMMFAFGNPTRNTGTFREAFGKMKHRWITRQIDSRTVSITNKKELERDIQDYGDDSDYVKVRIKGQFPSVSSMQFIGGDSVEQAIQREPYCALDDPLIMGVDVARFGDDQSVIAFRKGRDATIVPWEKYRGIDTMQLAARIVTAVSTYGVDAIFIDGGGIGGGVVDRVRQLNLPVFEVQFGSKAEYSFNTDERTRYANKRAEIWGNMRDWLKGATIPNDQGLIDSLIGVEYGYNLNQEILLESKKDMKKRGLASPDEGDALAVTFALPIYPTMTAGRPGYEHSANYVSDYDPFAEV